VTTRDPEPRRDQPTPVRPPRSRAPSLGRELRQYSLITWAFERLFWALHLLSPTRLVTPGRVAHQRSEHFRRDPGASVVRRSRRVEAYLFAWFVLEIAMLAGYAIGEPWPAWLVRTLVVIRVTDIMQAVVNLSVFDQLRLRGPVIISSAVRTVVLSFLNYLELLLCFALLYLSLPGELIGVTHWSDTLYFSVVTQLTIGYGDIRPVHWARLVASAQAIVSVTFTVLIFGRIIAVLPRLTSVLRHGHEDDTTE
jgi:hypothetical protein